MAFNKKRADDRKDLCPWSQHIPQTRMRRYACHPNAWTSSRSGSMRPMMKSMLTIQRRVKSAQFCLLIYMLRMKLYCTVANSDTYLFVQDSVTYTDFINKELVQFAKYDETPALLVAALIHPDSVGRTAWSWTIKSCCTILPINIMYNNIAYNGINMVLVVY